MPTTVLFIYRRFARICQHWLTFLNSLIGDDYRSNWLNDTMYCWACVNFSRWVERSHWRRTHNSVVREFICFCSVGNSLERRKRYWWVFLVLVIKSGGWLEQELCSKLTLHECIDSVKKLGVSLFFGRFVCVSFAVVRAPISNELHISFCWICVLQGYK